MDRLMYVELKSGWSDDGPAWIGYVRMSKSGKTVYFNDRALQRCRGAQGNYFDVESGEEYWVSGVKKHSSNRHPAGRGKVTIDSRAVEEFLRLKGWKRLSATDYVVKDIADGFPVDRVNRLLNSKQQ